MIDLRINNEKSEESLFDIILTIYIGADLTVIKYNISFRIFSGYIIIEPFLSKNRFSQNFFDLIPFNIFGFNHYRNSSKTIRIKLFIFSYLPVNLLIKSISYLFKMTRKLLPTKTNQVNYFFRYVSYAEKNSGIIATIHEVGFFFVVTQRLHVVDMLCNLITKRTDQ